MRSPEPGDIDGGEAQDEAERLGLLVRVKCTEPCGELCTCAEYHGEAPWECLRPATAQEAPPTRQRTDEEAVAAANKELDPYTDLFVNEETYNADVAESLRAADPRKFFITKWIRRLLVILGHAILDLREQLEAAQRERDAVADLMDDDLDAAVDDAAREECHGEVPGA
jgi:hypothetical protein